MTTSDRPRGGGTIPAAVARALAHASDALRARVLARLLRSVGTLALAVVGGGAFVRYAWQASAMSAEDAARFTSSQVLDLVSYVEQSDPAALLQVIAMLSHDATTMAALGASVAALAVRLARRGAAASRPTDA